MIYRQGGKPVREKIEDMGGGDVTRIVRGEALTYLEVRRTSAQPLGGEDGKSPSSPFLLEKFHEQFHKSFAGL